MIEWKTSWSTTKLVVPNGLESVLPVKLVDACSTFSFPNSNVSTLLWLASVALLLCLIRKPISIGSLDIHDTLPTYILLSSLGANVITIWWSSCPGDGMPGTEVFVILSVKIDLLSNDCCCWALTLGISKLKVTEIITKNVNMLAMIVLFFVILIIYKLINNDIKLLAVEEIRSN